MSTPHKPPPWSRPRRSDAERMSEENLKRAAENFQRAEELRREEQAARARQASEPDPDLLGWGDYVPTLRDQEIYAAVHLQGKKVANLAKEYGLSIRTIKNIVAATRDALARRLYTLQMREEISDLKEAADRLEAQWREAMEAWHDSREESKHFRVVCRGEEETTTATTKSQTGDPRLLNLANRILHQQLSLQAVLRQRDHEQYEKLQREPPEKQAAALKEFMDALYERIRRDDELLRQREAEAQQAEAAGEAAPSASPPDAAADSPHAEAPTDTAVQNETQVQAPPAAPAAAEASPVEEAAAAPSAEAARAASEPAAAKADQASAIEVAPVTPASPVAAALPARPPRPVRAKATEPSPAASGNASGGNAASSGPSAAESPPVLRGARVEQNQPRRPFRWSAPPPAPRASSPGPGP